MAGKQPRKTATPKTVTAKPATNLTLDAYGRVRVQSPKGSVLNVSVERAERLLEDGWTPA